MRRPINNGDLLWRRTEDSPLGNHYGIAVHLPDGLHVMHRQRHNGGVVQPLDEFLLGHPLRGQQPTRLTGQPADVLLARFERLRSGDFNIITNNCETWAYRYTGQWPALTDTDRRVLLVLALSAFILYLFTNAK